LPQPSPQPSTKPSPRPSPQPWSRDDHAPRGPLRSAIEEERRRLRRDLHDGLGLRLSGITFTADAARNSVRTDPDTAEHLLAQPRAEKSTAIEEIRGLVHAMRPPALDELGLVRARLPLSARVGS
jgi:signal transduction histidine kinase